MASSRRTGSNINTSTFGDGTRQYTALTTYESVVDVDTTASGTATTEQLHMYDDLSPYNQTCVWNGGLHDATYPVDVRCAPGHENRWTKDSGVRFEVSGLANHAFFYYTGYIYLHDCGLKHTPDGTSTYYPILTPSTNTHNLFTNLHIYDSDSAGTGAIGAGLFLYTGTDHGVVNTLIQNLSPGVSKGIYVSATGGHYAYNCVADSTFDGFYALSAGGELNVKNCIALNSGRSNYLVQSGAVFTTDSSHCLGDGGDYPTSGGHHIVNQTPLFVGTDYQLSTSDVLARHRGLNLANDPVFDFDDDVGGVTRQGAWDLGGWQTNTSRSSRRFGVNEDIQTHGGGGRNFTSVDVWEATIDTDKTATGEASSPVLELHRDGNASYDQTIRILGGVYDSQYRCIIRAAPGEEHNGDKNAGVHFVRTTAATGILLEASHVYLQDFGVSGTYNSASTFYDLLTTSTCDYSETVGLYVYDSLNSGAGIAHGLAYTNGDYAVIANCLFENIEGHGCWLDQDVEAYLYHSTSVNNGDRGYNFSGASGDVIVKNLIADGNGTDDYGDAASVHTGSQNCISSDATASALLGTGHISSTSTTFA